MILKFILIITKFKRCASVTDIGNNDEFDFGFGLESEFFNEGSNVGDENTLINMNDNNSFLEQLNNR
jgi:hypothetical protein